MIIPPNSTDFDFPDFFNAHQEEGGSICNRITNRVASFSTTAYREIPIELFRRFELMVEDVVEGVLYGKLYVALAYPDFELAESLLDSGAIPRANDLNRAMDSDIPTELFHRLVQRVKDVNEKARFGERPLDVALRNRNFEAVEILFDHGAISSTENLILEMDSDMPIGLFHRLVLKVKNINEEDGSGERLLDFAWDNHHFEAVDIFLDYGAMPRANDLNQAIKHKIPTELFHRLIQRVKDVNKKARIDKTPLFTALEKSNFEAVEILLDHGAILSIDDLIQAIESKIPTELFHRLMQKVKDVNEKDWDDERPLFTALDTSNLEAAEILLDYGEIPTIEDLNQAIKRKILKNLLRRLVQKVKDVNEKDWDDVRPLVVALNISNFEAVDILLDHGARPTIKDLIQVIVIRRKIPIELFRRLVQKVKDVNKRVELDDIPLITRQEDACPLEVALWKHNFEAAKVLLENGADPSLVDPSIPSSPEIENVLQLYRTLQEFVRNLNGVLRLFIFEKPEQSINTH